MKNLEQIRAKNALDASNDKFKGVNDGQIVKKVPTMIMENGIIATLAFSLEKNDKGRYKNEDMKKIFDKVVIHLQSDGINKFSNKNDAEQLLTFLLSSDSPILRNITAETMAYLNYLRRFANK